MSVESRQEKSWHPDYAEADLSENPNTLYRIATETHVTALHGGIPSGDLNALKIVVFSRD